MPLTPYTLRTARVADVPRLREIEVLAGVAFRALAMDAVADDPPPDAAEYEELVDAGRAWVATVDDDRPIAYVVVDLVDGQAHVEQVSVDPRRRGHGIGAALIERSKVGGGAGHRHAHPHHVRRGAVQRAVLRAARLPGPLPRPVRTGAGPPSRERTRARPGPVATGGDGPRPHLRPLTFSRIV